MFRYLFAAISSVVIATSAHAWEPIQAKVPFNMSPVCDYAYDKQACLVSHDPSYKRPMLTKADITPEFIRRAKLFYPVTRVISDVFMEHGWLFDAQNFKPDWLIGYSSARDPYYDIDAMNACLKLVYSFDYNEDIALHLACKIIALPRLPASASRSAGDVQVCYLQKAWDANEDSTEDTPIQERINKALAAGKACFTPVAMKQLAALKRHNDNAPAGNAVVVENWSD